MHHSFYRSISPNYLIINHTHILSAAPFIFLPIYANQDISTINCYTLFDYPIDPYGRWDNRRQVNTHSIYDLVTQFESPINIAEIMRANASSEASKYWDFNRTWTWKGTANGKTVTAICPKLKWEK